MRDQPLSHREDFAEVLGRIQQTRQRVFTQANTALLDLYWRIGQTLKNLWRMKQFYEAYQGDAELSSLVRELPWTHNTIIFSRCKSPDERQIDAAGLERATQSPPRLSAALRVLQPAAAEVFKDRYTLELLGLPEPHSESDLKRARVPHMKAFVLELGKDFLFVGEEFRLQVGNQDFDEVVECALSRNLSPALVAQYQLQLPDKGLIAAKTHKLLATHEGLGDE